MTISPLNGGNCSRDEHEAYQRIAPLYVRFPRVVPPPTPCPHCLGHMREVEGFDDYCPTCRQREELRIEREAVATGKIQLTGWLEGWSDVPNSL